MSWTNTIIFCLSYITIGLFVTVGAIAVFGDKPAGFLFGLSIMIIFSLSTIKIIKELW